MKYMAITCSKCHKIYRDMFDTVVRCDYVEPGKGKPYEWHLCIDCRKKLIYYFNDDVKLHWLSIELIEGREKMKNKDGLYWADEGRIKRPEEMRRSNQENSWKNHLTKY